MSTMTSQITSLTNGLFRRRSKKTSKLRVTGLCEGNSPVTGEFPAQRTSKLNAETVSIWWRHHGMSLLHLVLLNSKLTRQQIHLLWPGDPHMCQWAGSSLDQVIVFSCSARGHHWKLWWLIVKQTPKTLQWNLHQNKFLHYAFKKVRLPLISRHFNVSCDYEMILSTTSTDLPMNVKNDNLYCNEGRKFRQNNISVFMLAKPSLKYDMD